MVTKKIRTEYMKKFKDPRWETFSKCYEDSLKYRLTRRVMEHSHNPWFWEGWESRSDSSGWSTPRLTRNRVSPLSLPPPSCEVKQRLCELVSGPGAGHAPAMVEQDAAPETVSSEASAASATEDTPSSDTEDTPSSDTEPANPAPKPRYRRRRVPCAEPGGSDGFHDDTQPAVARKPPRAKSQPAIGSKEKESRRPTGRLDWTERQKDVRRTNNQQSVVVADAGVEPRVESDRRRGHGGRGPGERRRARSADLEKVRRSQLTAAVDERWTTEYMRCFSARLR
ncbi:centriole, cilia and spindle-associated protein-like isoform X1 [Solea senegalensis]|uniref:Centriole, cilia and spindle-associated protein-like isoform X1 n=1 Tax=Solea senegalensis TaxID=28829 RepID=A0AAV6PKK7_SOLSE|nr:centriole, cilia and spindle-associated protein-like [Solea senegalensis]XP_043874943.1 centriole, cilia and spindle-associated protein-like [Solea senegalensis]KAG7465392.1 centriole, cilia and spindle-associated protein-like isoform X1 [Solea senegalensis]KAG7466675.1 centriole, cilia and spindle-associated protein-like isoform X1 [Solea senegalensis]